MVRSGNKKEGIMEKLPEWVRTSEDYEKWKRGERPTTSSGKLYNEHDFICTACHHVGTPAVKTKGSFWIEIVLWCFFLVPGLTYTIWRLTSKVRICPACGNATMIPVTTPVGHELLR
jgi:hypothetical protein